MKNKKLNVTNHQGNVNQNHRKIPSYPHQNSYHLKRQNINADKGTRKREPHMLLMGMKLAQPLWKTVWQFLKQLENRPNIWSSNSTTRYISKGKKISMSKRYLYFHVHWSNNHNVRIRNKPRCLSMCEWSENIQYIYKVKYYLALKRIEFCNWWEHGGYVK